MTYADRFKRRGNIKEDVAFPKKKRWDVAHRDRDINNGKFTQF